MKFESQTPHEPALRESEAHYRTLLEDQTEIICRFRSDGTILFVNEVYCRFFGKSAPELTGSKWQPLAFPEDLPHIEGQLRKLTPAQPVVVIENRVFSGDGQVHWMQFVNRAFFDPQGRLVETQSVGRDITERKLAEQALQRSQAELKVIYENAPTMMCVLDAARQVLYANRAFADFVGKPAEDLRSERACGVIGCLRALDDPQGCGHGPHCETCAVRLAMVDALATGRSHRGIEYRTTALCQGQPRESVFLASVAPIKIAGRSELLLCLEDITERQRAQDELRVSEERYRLLVDTSLDAVLLTAPCGRIFSANAAACRMFGRSETELIEAGREGVVDVSDPRLAAALEERARTGRFHGELTYLRRDGSKFPGEISTAVFYNHAGEARTSMVIRDITERKQTEQNLQQLSHRLLRLQDEERRRLARELHDTLAQELAALLMQLNLLQSALPRLKPAAAERLASSVELATRCANEVRTMSYMLHPPLLEALGLAGAVRDYADGLARRSGLRVDLDISEDLGRWPHTVELALFRVLQEALANAHRHSGSATASIRLVRQADGLRLEVVDHGHGLGTAKVADAVENGASGMGVGIPGMRERLRQLGGRLEIKSSRTGTSIIAFVPESGQDARL